MKKPFLFAALAAVLMTPTAPAWAQAAYPTKPIKIVVPFPAGGTSDVLARIVGQKMTESWGQPVVIENRPGSSGNLGADLVAKSPADGHTLVLMDVGNLVISPALFKLPFNVEKDFAPVAMVAYSPHLLAVSTKVPANTPAELVAYAKAQKGKLNYAVAAGMGSASHLAGVMYAQRNGLEWGYVPYTSSLVMIREREDLKAMGLLEVEAISYIRGRSIPNRFFILDEAQQLTPHEVKTVITRISESSKLVLIGDPAQIDNPFVDSRSNGLVYCHNRLKGQSIAVEAHRHHHTMTG